MRHQKDRDGYVLVVMAFVLVLLLGFAALAVDVGVMYGAHTSAQRAADAAALAGAFTFIESPYATDPAALATAQATSSATVNTILGTSIQNGEVSVNVDVANQRVTVNLSHTMPTFFAGVLGQKSATVAVVAYAEAGTTPTSSPCTKPWFMPNNILSTRNLCTAGSGACAQQELLIQNNAATAWALQHVGTEFTVKPGNPASALGPGNFYAIKLNNDLDTGGDDYRDNIATCNSTASTINCGDLYYVKTGNMIGPTTQGTSLLISYGATQQKNQLSSYLDTWGGVDGATGSPYYCGPGATGPSCATRKTFSKQVVTAPIWDSCALCPSGALPGNGSNAQVAVIGFAQIFISGITNGNDVQARLIGVAACGSSPPAPVVGVMGYPLRLVRMD
jgi:Flp pilus assembly protein TadG